MGLRGEREREREREREQNRIAQTSTKAAHYP